MFSTFRPLVDIIMSAETKPVLQYDLDAGRGGVANHRTNRFSVSGFSCAAVRLTFLILSSFNVLFEFKELIWLETDGLFGSGEVLQQRV